MSFRTPAYHGSPSSERGDLGLGTAALHNVQDFAGAGSGVPSGAIMVWSGSVLNVPVGWLVADGTKGTMDMKAAGLMIKASYIQKI